MLDVSINKPLKNRISELADMSYEKNLEKWENGKYTVGDQRIMLTHWVGQAWREMHQQNTDLIRQTLRNVGLSLAVDGSEDHELKIKDIPNQEVSVYVVGFLILHIGFRSIHAVGSRKPQSRAGRAVNRAV